MGFLTSIDWGDLLKNILVIIGAAAAITKITPWKWDDKAIGWIVKILRVVGLQKKEE